MAVSAAAAIITAGASAMVHIPWLALLAPLAGAVAYFASRPSAEALATKPAAMIVCPWGIAGARPVRWRDIDEIIHRTETETHGRTQVHYSVLVVRIGGERFVGKTSSDSFLDALDALLPIYKSQGSLPLALELSPTSRALDLGATETFHPLLTAARTLLDSPTGRALTDETATSYRGGARVVRPETIALLSRLLVEKPVTVDLGPLAAVLAAELDVVDTIDELLALTMSPHPFVAAIARGAASRLGVHPSRSFPIHELTPFLGEAETDAIAAWAKEKPQAAPKERHT